MGAVDIVVGGQYGDEGKGRVAMFLADKYKYRVCVRVGGQNAEHRARAQDGTESVHHILPIGTVSKSRCTAALAAGMTFSLDLLESEISQVEGNFGRRPVVLVDRNAALVTPTLIEAGREAAEARGSTFMGVGATVAAKVRRDFSCRIAGDCEQTLLARGVDRVLNVSRHLHLVLQAGGRVLVEASQGTMLSLDHGHYPYCTSRNTTASGALSDAGLNHKNVGAVVMVVKTIPTRVPGPSGPTGGRELSWKEVCLRAGRPYEEIRQTEGGVAGAGNGAGGIERPFDLSLRELHYAANLNGATHIAVTFLDWWSYADAGKTMWDYLTRHAQDLVLDIEGACQAPVFFVGTGPNYEDFILRGTPPGGQQ